MKNVANTAPGAAETGTKKSLKERAVGELERYVVISIYLWLLFAIFSLHRQLLQGHGISVWQHGFAIVNALILGKAILIAQELEIGKGLERRALVWSVLGKSVLFAILVIAFHISEEAIRAVPGSAFVIRPRRLGRYAAQPRDLYGHFLCHVDSVLCLPGSGSGPRRQRPLELVPPHRREAVSGD
jgi:hypothetical protein